MRKLPYIAGTLLLAAAPVFGQTAQKHKHGMYAKGSETCNVFSSYEKGKDEEHIGCDVEKVGVTIDRMGSDGKLETVSFHYPDGRLQMFVIVTADLYNGLKKTGNAAGFWPEGSTEVAEHQRAYRSAVSRVVMPENHIDTKLDEMRRVDERVLGYIKSQRPPK